jgi:hypothetical protein
MLIEISGRFLFCSIGKLQLYELMPTPMPLLYTHTCDALIAQ